MLENMGLVQSKPSASRITRLHKTNKNADGLGYASLDETQKYYVEYIYIPHLLMHTIFLMLCESVIISCWEVSRAPANFLHKQTSSLVQQHFDNGNPSSVTATPCVETNKQFGAAAFS